MFNNANSAQLQETIAGLARDRAEGPTADRCALAAPGRGSMNYRQLHQHLQRVHGQLREMGIGGQDRVAVVLSNGPEMAGAFLAIGAAAACAPLNPAYGAKEFDFYLADLDAKAVAVSRGSDSVVRAVARDRGIAVLELSYDADSPAGLFDLTPQPIDDAVVEDFPGPEDTALLLHTSGTTSRPKLVPLSHRNLVASMRHISRSCQLTHDDVCLNVMPLFHIHGLVGVLLSSMFAGGSVVCSAGFDNSSFADLMRDFEPTWYSAVPTIHQSVLALAKANPAVAAGGRLRFIRSSSSSLPPTVMAELEETFRVPVIESYGMTEAAHQMASNPLPPAERKPGSVGLPAGPEIAIMDEEGHLLPAGEIGEIVIRGTNVTAGYANNPEANTAAFTDGWFRTGDLGRTDNDGYFHITGRKKEMINRGGENISPREIDEVLLEHPAVIQAVAFAVPHPSLGEDVATAIVLQDGMDASEQELREFAFTQLAEFKVPSQIIFVDAIPKGPTGKLQRIGLHEQLAPLLKAEYVAPDGPIESKLAALWTELLSLQRVGRNDNFFACGGDSLLATRLVARVRADLNVELSLPALFHQPTLHAQAALVDEALLAAKQADEQELTSLLDELDGLSDEEAARLLASERQDAGPGSVMDTESSDRE